MKIADKMIEAGLNAWFAPDEPQPLSEHYDEHIETMTRSLEAAFESMWQPIEKDYIDAEVYICYFPENKGVEKYKAHGLLSVAKTKGATHYMIPQPPIKE